MDFMGGTLRVISELNDDLSDMRAFMENEEEMNDLQNTFTPIGQDVEAAAVFIRIEDSEDFGGAFQRLEDITELSGMEGFSIVAPKEITGAAQTLS